MAKRKTRRKPGTVHISTDQTYGIIFMRDGRRFIFGAVLGSMVLIRKHGDPTSTVMITSVESDDNELFQDSLEHGTYRPMNDDDQGEWELTTSLLQPHHSLRCDSQGVWR